MRRTFVGRDYIRRLLDGNRALGSQTEHYWRWPIRLRWRWLGRQTWTVSLHGVRDGVVHVRKRGIDVHPLNPATRSFLWIGPIGIEFGAGRQAIEDRRWRARLIASEEKPDVQ